ncbi:hypothetical protein [Haliangium ochraceum]|uniref:hypothetical protein n=1 Tax=Haliangium ochraceum TaxID=80816 RepID=UPI00019B9894|nr:hypothetical protein [Haliangium ochraceum]
MSHPLAPARAQTAALAVAGIAVGYALLSVWYFYQDFFQFLQAGTIMVADRSGFMVPTDHPLVASVLSPWRIIGAALAVALLGVSARSLWVQRPGAGALTLFSVWGVLLPQTLWYTEFMSDWHAGACLGSAIVAALLVASVPTALVFAGRHTLRDWNPAPRALRLLGLAIALAWLAFAGTQVMDRAYQFADWSDAYLAALGAVCLGALAAHGLMNLRTWALWAGIAAALAMAVVPLELASSFYMPHFAGSYVNALHSALLGSECRALMTALFPVAAIGMLSAPYLHGFVRKLRA